MVKTTTTSLLRAAAVFGGIVSGTVPLAADEVLPWANSPPAVAAAEPVADPAMEAAASQCAPLFEAACRDLNTCAWIADVALQDGTVIPARCVARPPAPPKSTDKSKTPPPKKKTAEPSKAPAVKAAASASKTETGALPAKAEPKADALAPVIVNAPQDPAPAAQMTSSEPPVQAAATPPPPAAPAQAKTVVVEPPAKPQAAPVAEKKKPAEPPAKAAAAPVADAKKAEQQAAKGPAAVTPPPPGAAPPQMPGFGSVPTAFPAGNAVVTTTVPPRSSE